MTWTNTFDEVNSVLVKDLMNTQYKTIYPDDSLRTVIINLRDSKLDTLPVIDHEGKLVGIFPRRHLYTALLECTSMDDLCTPYIVYSTYLRYSEDKYDQTLVGKVINSKVGNAPVVDSSGNLVGMIGKIEYLRQALFLLIKANALLESVFQAIHEGMIVVNNNGYILNINQTAEQMLGIASADIQGKYLEDILPEIVFSEIHFENGSLFRFKGTIHSIAVIISAVPIIENGSQIGISFAFQDMSDIENIAHELETTKELQTTLDAVINASTYGVLVTDKTGLIRYVNEITSQLFDMTAESIIGKAFNDYVPASGTENIADSAFAKVEICQISGKNCIVSHVPVKSHIHDKKSAGFVSTVYCNDNKLIEEILKKWSSLQHQVQYYRDELEKLGDGKASFDKIVSKNADLIRIKKDAQRIAHSGSTILLTGESGVGKDMFARAIHSASSRAKFSLVKVNCAAIAETLMESELFGYVAGSFTGASKNGKIGYFEQANKGTIFLDEIGDMPLSIQVKILQVLQDKQFMRVGESTPRSIDVRIIAATNRDLQEAITKGLFREDLYYRLNVIELNLPPLRSRPEDILLLAETFVQKYNHILGSKITAINKTAQEALVLHDWPGNIRELENAIERAANYAWEGEIGVEHLPSRVLQFDDQEFTPSSYRSVLHDVDKEIIADTLKITKGNKSAAARLLKISRTAFYEKLVKYGLY